MFAGRFCIRFFAPKTIKCLSFHIPRTGGKQFQPMSASISFYLRNDRNLTGNRPLYLRVIIDRKVKNYSTGKTIEQRHWDQDKEQVKPSYSLNIELNTWITRFRMKAEKAILDIENNNLPLSLETFHQRFTDQDNRGLFKTWVLEVINNRRFKVSPDYSEQLTVILTKFFDWKPDLKFSDLTTETIEAYERHLFTIGNQQNTVSNNLKRIRYFVEMAHQKGYIKLNPFAGVRLKWTKTYKEILSFADIEALEKHLPEMPDKVQKSLHAFLFALYHGGLRYADLCILKPEHLRADGIHLVQHKTNNNVFIPWNPAGKHHLPAQLTAGKPVFHIISEQKFRDHLKLAAMYAEVKVDITTRTARHTFISLSSALGMNFKMISQIAGHTSVKMTERYHHAQSGVLINEIQKWGFLN
jgi:site-specific recombinase XerD